MASSSHNEILLEIKNLAKTYNGQNYALGSLNLQLTKGDIYAVTGPSGSGKTTLLRLIAGLEYPTLGCIKFKGKTLSDDQSHVPPQQRKIGMVFQDLALFPHLNVHQNIGFALPKAEHQKISSLLDLVNLKGFGKRYPHELSGGEQQRVALARTLAPAPELLLLDEPFSNLDTNLKVEIRAEIRGIVKNLGLSAIFITHNIYDALDIADHIAVMKNGHLQLDSPINQLLSTKLPEDVELTFHHLEKMSSRLNKLMQKRSVN